MCCFILSTTPTDTSEYVKLYYEHNRYVTNKKVLGSMNSMEHAADEIRICFSISDPRPGILMINV